MIVYVWSVIMKQSIFKHIQCYHSESTWIIVEYAIYVDLYNLIFLYILRPYEIFPAAPARLPVARLKSANLLLPLFWHKALKFKHFPRCRPCAPAHLQVGASAHGSQPTQLTHPSSQLLPAAFMHANTRKLRRLSNQIKHCRVSQPSRAVRPVTLCMSL